MLLLRRYNCLYWVNINFITSNFYRFMISILASNPLEHLCVCFAFIWSWLCLLKPLLLLSPLPSSERFANVWTEKQRQKMGDMVWFVANSFSCQAAGNGLGANFAVLIGTIAPWIAFGLWTSGSATLQEPFHAGTRCTRILTFYKEE